MTFRPRRPSDPEFAPGVDQPPGEATRREFMRWFAASAALGGLTGCGRTPNERRYPYNDTPNGLTPGTPQHYATAHVTDGYAVGLVVQAREGRPIKVEGNPDHPASLGATGPREQGLVLEVYDPRRLDALVERKQPRGWDQLFATLSHREDDGRGLCLLLEPTGSPLRGALIESIRQRFPAARVCFYAAGQGRAGDEATRRLTGDPLQIHHDFRPARRVLSLDADFMDQMPFGLRYARQFADNRRVQSARGEMNRLYMVECKPTTTGSLADEHLACRSSDIGTVAAAVLVELLGTGAAPRIGAVLPLLRQTRCSDHLRQFAIQVAADLMNHRGASVVLAGDRQPWPVHVLAHAINELLGNFGSTVAYSDPVLRGASEAEIGIEELTEQMHAGEIDTLLIAGVDPVYSLPPSWRFGQALQSVETSIYWGLFESATSLLCRWVVPAAHELETWGDAVAYDGTTTLMQPLIRPLAETRTLDELLALWTGRGRATAHELLQESWIARFGGGPQAVEQLERALQLGLVPGTEVAPVEPPAASRSVLSEAITAIASDLALDEGLELSLYPSPCVHDGRFAHNAWLQELPEPITKLTWGNALMIAPPTAVELGLSDGDEVEVQVDEQRIRGPVLVVPGHAEGAVSAYLGYGQVFPERPHFDPLAPEPPPTIGFNAYELRRVADRFFALGAHLRPTGASIELARTQDHFEQYDRELALVEPLETLHEQGHLAKHLRGPLEHLFLVEQETRSPQWGMVIDQTVCSGCSACVVACQAENNIHVVGESGVRKGREMHWLRIDRYYVGPPDRPTPVHQPMLCQHCEMAPCEYVCPVNATVHSPDGLNEMIYNRCIGTRFCSNNCPYKVRRFNWFDYVQRDRRALQRNPEVTVRERGVMEKCTYCVQRIRNASIEADLEDRGLIDGEVVTACQQACPTQAIVFGDISDPDSEVSQWLRRPHQYAVLHEQGTQPRTRYLVKLRNPGPEVT